jgi:pimeloyl-ACP methyl ester carboxylesterase
MDRYTHDGLTFDLTERGPSDGRSVILLHGFPEDRHCWAALADALADAGYRALAPDQRGYSPGARPRGRRSYTLEKLSGDVLALADSAGAARFDVVGHDWGAAVGWYLAGAHRDRVRSLTALSVPHPGAVVEALGRSRQPLRSWYMLYFQLPALPELMLSAGGGTRFAGLLRGLGLDAASAERAAKAGAMTGPLNWYRALPFDARRHAGPVTAPTLFVWGERDRFVTRVAAERCGRHVSGPYCFVPLPEADHWLPSGAPHLITPLLLRHLGHSAPAP